LIGATHNQQIIFWESMGSVLSTETAIGCLN
jgi:hypothetical protein